MENLKWCIPEDNFSNIPDYFMENIKRMANFITIEKINNEENKILIRYSKKLCSNSVSLRDMSMDNEYLQSSMLDPTETFTLDVSDFSLFLGCKEKLSNCNIVFHKQFIRRPCTVIAAAYYKYLTTYNKEEYDRQRDLYKKNQDKIDTLWGPDYWYLNCKLEDMPHINTKHIKKIQQDIHNGKYRYGFNDDIYYVFNSDTLTTKSFKLSSKDFTRWIDECKNYKEQDYFYEEYLDVLRYVFIHQLMQYNLIDQYYERELEYEKEINANLTGNYYYACIAGTDRNEVMDEIQELCKKIKYSFSLKGSNYYHITINDLMLKLAVAENWTKPIVYNHIRKDVIYVLTGLTEFINIYHTFEKDPGVMEGRQIQHIIKELTRFDNNNYIILAGTEKEIEEFLKINESLKLIFSKNYIKINDFSIDELYELFKENLNKQIELTDENEQEFKEYLLYNRKSFPFQNGQLAKYIADLCISENKFILPYNISNEKNKNFMEDLNKLIGLDNIKQEVEKLYKYQQFCNIAKEEKMNIASSCLHMVFTGNPGTGKTTVARIIAKALYEIGIIKNDNVVEVQRKDLIGEYIGHTAIKTQNVIDKAIGGVLFIDEAYALNVHHKNDFGHEAIATLVKAMEDHKDNLIIIFAGYKKEMQEFIDINPGLSSRIGYTFHFEDYTKDELYAMLQRKMQSSNLKLMTDTNENIMTIIDHFYNNENLGNGRFIDKLYQQILIKHAINFDNNLKTINEIAAKDIPTIEEMKMFINTKENRQLGFI